MAYTKQRADWIDGEAGGTLIRAQDLDGMEQGIFDAAATADSAAASAAVVASTTATGRVELATTAEATAGTDATRAVTPAGLKAGVDEGKKELVIAAGTDLDAISTPGTYIQAASANATFALHYPIEVAGHLEVLAGGWATHYSQRYTSYLPSNPKVFVRSFYNGSWGAWQESSVVGHTHTTTDISNSTAVGRSVLAAADAAAARAAIGAGTYDAASATTSAQGIVELATTTEATTGTDTTRAVTPAGVKAVADTKAPLRPTLNAQTGTTYTVVLADESKMVTLTNAAAITVTIPTNATAAFPVGAQINFTVLGAGMATIVGASGVTVRATPSAVTRAQYSVVTAMKIATDEWLLMGDLA